MKILVLVFTSCLLVAAFSLQAQVPADYKSNEEIVDQGRSDLLTVAALGLGGAVLGLSTLSFKDEPEDHLDNIVTGGALGIIAGVIYVAYIQASAPPSFDSEPREVRPVDGVNYSYFRQHSGKRPAKGFSDLAFSWQKSF